MTKLKPEVVFGGLSVAIGLVALIYESKRSNNSGTTIIPPLQGAAADSPAYTSLPATVNTTAPAQNVPYLSTNYGPRHNWAKALTQQAETQAAQQADACCDPCSKAKTKFNKLNQVPRDKDKRRTWAQNQIDNFNSVGLTPTFPAGNTPNTALFSNIAQYNNAVAAEPYVTLLNGQGDGSVQNVPSSDLGVWRQ